jgi:hypothetical protein
MILRLLVDCDSRAQLIASRLVKRPDRGGDRQRRGPSLKRCIHKRTLEDKMSVDMWYLFRYIS